MFEYSKDNRYFAQIAGSLELIVKEELSKIGATDIEVSRSGCHFTADDKTLYKILLLARTPQRILAPLVKFDCFSTKYLGILTYKDIHWSELFSLEEKFGIITNVKDSVITNSLYAGQVMKDAICNQFRLKTGERPDFSNKEADIIFNLHIDDNKATISLDLTGTSMHKRGYKLNSVKGSIQETIAAALIQLTEWNGENKFIDLMCGAGTFLGEALIHYCRLPNDTIKDNTYIEKLPTFNQKLWDEVKAEIKAEIRALPKSLIFGNDNSPTAVVSTLRNLKNLPLGDRAVIQNRNFKDIQFIRDTTVIINPPFGDTFDDQASLLRLYTELGVFFKEKCTNCQVFVLAGDKKLLDAMKLKPEWLKTIRTGPVDSIFAKYFIY